MALIQDRGESGPYKKVYAFNAHFYVALSKGGYVAVKEWTQRVMLL